MNKSLALIIVFAIGLIPDKLLAKDFKKYLYYTNKAENSIVMGNYVQAQCFYDSSFHYWDKPFAIDLYNELKCANLDSDFVTVTILARKLIALGCSLSFFESPDYLYAYRHSAPYRSLIKEYPAIRAKYIKNNNWELRTKIEMLQAKDQYLRRLDHNYTFLKDSIYKADDTIKTMLRSIFKHKFPNEYDYGVFLNNDTTMGAYEPLHIIILHNYRKFDTAQLPNANMHSFDFTPILKDAVEKGNMHPQEFAYLNDRAGQYIVGGGYGQFNILVKLDNEKLYFNNFAINTQEEFDSNRKDINLDSYGEEKEKAIYSASNGNGFIFFRHMGYISILKGIPFTEKMIKNMFIYAGKKAE